MSRLAIANTSGSEADVTPSNPVPVNVTAFQPIPVSTLTLTVGPTATTAPVALPAVTAVCYRARNPITSASPVRMSTHDATVPPPDKVRV